MVQHKAIVPPGGVNVFRVSQASVAGRLCNELRVRLVGAVLSTRRKALSTPLSPAFHQLRLADFELINTPPSTFTAVKIQKCRKLLAIIITLSTSQRPLTIPPPMIDPKYWRGYLH